MSFINSSSNTLSTSEQDSGITFSVVIKLGASSGNCFITRELVNMLGQRFVSACDLEIELSLSLRREADERLGGRSAGI